MTSETPSYAKTCAQSPHLKMLGLLSATWMARCIYVALKHGLISALAEGMVPSALAAATGLPEPGLSRLLLGLEHLEVIEARAGGGFRLTEAGTTLLPDRPGSLADMATLWGEEFHRAWTSFPEALAGGKTAFDLHHGQSLFEYLGENPAVAARFNRAMQSIAQLLYPALPDVVDFSQSAEIMDVGGGTGFLLAQILGRHPRLRGTLFDLPEVVAEARGRAWEAGVAARMRFCEGDFFAALPPGADTLLLANVLHDWDEAAAAKILAGCRRALDKEGRLIIVEMILGHGNTPFLARSTDLNMLVLTGGRERTFGEFEGLLAQAGFDIAAVHNVLDMTCALEARPV